MPAAALWVRPALVGRVGGPGCGGDVGGAEAGEVGDREVGFDEADHAVAVQGCAAGLEGEDVEQQGGPGDPLGELVVVGEDEYEAGIGGGVESVVAGGDVYEAVVECVEVFAVVAGEVQGGGEVVVEVRFVLPCAGVTTMTL